MIRVGAPSEAEAKTLKEAFEDASAAWGGHSSGHTHETTNSADRERESVLQ